MSNKRFIPLHRPETGDEEIAAVTRVIRSGWLAQGPEVEAFEREFGAFVGAPHAVAVSSGTAALELALRALGIGPGDDVLTVSLSFIATANAVRAVGARPVFVDIDPATLNLDPAALAASATPATRAVLAVHQLGLPCDMAAVGAFAAQRSLAVVEDAACAAGSEIAVAGRWQRIGAPHGDVACFSFHARKTITTGEGGMITTARDDLADRVRLLRSHGMSADAHARHRAARVAVESYVAPGSNHRLSDVGAALGRAQLVRLPGIVARRRALAARYGELLAAIADVAAPAEPAWARTNWQSYCVRLAARVDRTGLMQRLLDRGIATRRGVMCAHREPAWPPGSWAGGPLPRSEAASDRGLLLPLYPSMAGSDQDRVIATLAEALGA